MDHARIEENVSAVDELVGPLHQEDQTQTCRLARQISRERGLTQCSINYSPRSWSKVSFVDQHAYVKLDTLGFTFFDIYISQSSVVYGVVGYIIITLLLIVYMQCASERSLKICQ